MNILRRKIPHEEFTHLLEKYSLQNQQYCLYKEQFYLWEWICSMFYLTEHPYRNAYIFIKRNILCKS